MKRKVATLRLSPNEEARLIREEQERRRKLRILQVREQQRSISLQIRREVERRRQQELQSLEEQLREDWERQHQEKLLKLQRQYQENLQLLGQGHRSAKENEPDWAAIGQRKEENNAKAEERYREALKELKSQRKKDHEEQKRSINARKKALQVEKERSAKIASLPLPPPSTIESIEHKRAHIVTRSDVSTFSATHYHMPEAAVDREVDSAQLNAQEAAEQEVRRLQELGREAEQEREEQLEKARLRGKHALRRELLMQDRERLLVELEHMQQTDLLRRRQQVSQMPAQIFQPLYKRQQMREDYQREMEFAFEDMYTGERRFKGDLMVQLVPEPLPAPSTGSQDQELDVTLDDAVTPGTENTQQDTEQEAGSTEQETSAQAEPSRAAPRRALKKLLDRIRSQREQQSGVSGRVPVAEPPITVTNEIPERDISIDTGSLISEERDAPQPTNPPEPSHSPPALEATEESIVAGTLLLPDVLAYRIQEFEEERKKREEELEREKQQQMALLQELEEQKDRLEQMLLEAQQDRETLKAAVTQELPVCNQGATSVTPGLATEPDPDAGEEDHTRRIREYQQRLLEQNRLHKRSMEVAHQRLEEYQRALRIRYNMTTSSFPPPDVPAGLVRPPPQCAESASPLVPPLQLPTVPVSVPLHVPAAQAKPQPPVETPTRESESVAHPLPVPSLGIDSRSLPVQRESPSDSCREQRPGVTAFLTDNIMERVTHHLPDRMKPSSLAHRPLTTHCPAANVSFQPSSDPVQAISPPPLPAQASVKSGILSRGSLQSESSGSLGSKKEDMARQRMELLEAQTRLQEQREAMEQQQRQKEEEREQMRRQREALQALISTDTQVNDKMPASEVPGKALVSEDIGETRLKLLASLLRAIEESNGGTLSHLEENQEPDSTAHQEPSTSDDTAHQSDAVVTPTPSCLLPSGLHLPPRAPKPPVTRVRLGIMTEQHELSAIQEVETPVNTSAVTGPEDSVKILPHPAAWDSQDKSESSVASDRFLHSLCVSTGGHQSAAGRLTGSATSLARSNAFPWKERLLTGAGRSPESTEYDRISQNLSPPSPDSGTGADLLDPVVTSLRSPTECAHRPSDVDCLSSTISTGSYITTDPEQNSSHTDSPPRSRLCVEQEPGGGAASLDVSSPSSQSSGDKDGSAAGPPSPAVDSLFHDSSIQRIIDKYTRELNISLNTAGNTTASSADRDGSCVEEPSSLVSQQSWAGVAQKSGEEEQRPADSQLLPSDSAGPQRFSLQVWDNTVNQILERFSDQVSSLVQDQGQDSFRPLIGQLADQSSCLAADQGASAVEHLIGQPSAHSSMIGQPPGQSVSVSTSQGAWDSTLSRMIGRLSLPLPSHWLSGGQDFYASQLIGQMDLEQSSAWLDGGQEESQMRLLAGELDESAGQRSGSSGERTNLDLVSSVQTNVPSDQVSAAQAQSHSFPLSELNPQSTASSAEQSPERSEVFPASDSFHPLLAEVTHNETADPSMTFHLPGQEVPYSPAGAGRTHSSEINLSGHYEQSSEVEFEPPASPSVESELSPENFRAEEPPRHLAAPAALQESFCHLAISHCDPHPSVLLTMSPAAQEAELATLSLSGLTLCDARPTLDLLPPEGGDMEGKNILDGPGSFIPVSDPNDPQGSNLRKTPPAWDKIMDAATGKGILEESEITLLSLTDTTLQDQEATIIEEEKEKERRQDEGQDEMREEDQKGGKAEVTVHEESGVKWLPEETLKEELSHSHTATLLEFEWSPSGVPAETIQQKRRALLQRSSHRVQEIKAKRAQAKSQAEVRGPSEAQERTKPREARPASCEAKTKSEPPNTKTKQKRKQTAVQTTETAHSITAGSSKLLPPVSDRLKKVGELKNCTPEQRKRDVSEMHQRTQRLYEQLEEVKQQKEMRSRQEAYAQNRVKAKEFHRKTLQKLRAKQTPQ
ncbi:centrosomal protein of 295 kDa isoform X3 [Myripristis murdjan]|uniref:centrosomal protein of 295 kDa isoform X3 n=1 Tax=Myripristis murdjan TaxID=586833 RepID=UPI0011762893|nr:centrosomal protein of 295 kDa isoform X3 [Myripristis murdjan]